VKPASLVRRAVVIVLLAELLCAVAFSCTALLHERRLRLRAFDVALQGRSDSLLGAIQDAEDPEDNVGIDPAELSLPETDVYAVYMQGGRLLGSSAGAPEALIARAGEGFRNLRFRGHRYRVLQREALRIIDRAEYGREGLRRPVTIVYAAPTDHIWSEIFEAARFYAAVSLTLLCLTAALLILLLRRLLQPIGELAAEASAVTANSLQFKPPPNALRSKELRPLAQALSATIARLRQSFEMEQRFISDAAHELKTAVAVVRSTVQVLAIRPRTKGEYREGLSQILADNARVEDLLARMLTLARLEEGRGSESATEDMREAVERTLGRVNSYAEAHEVKVCAELTPGLRARISPEGIDTLVSNLVINAVQHSPRGSEVQVNLLPGSADRDAITLEVKDKGAGIAPEALPHIFERFFREDSSRSRQTGGAGLGLAICKSIVDAAGGEIRVRSQPGSGTAVSVTFSHP
jgi:signal transduction histidine kinase